MKLTTLLVSLVILSVAGYVSPRTPPIEHDVPDVNGVPATISSADPQFPAKEYLSNAERIQRGLPLNPPQRRSESLVARAPQPSSATGTTGRLFAVFGDTSMGRAATLLPRELARNGDSGFTRVGATFGEDYEPLPGGPGNNAFDTNSYNFAAITGTDDGAYRERPHPGKTSYAPAPNNFIEPAIFTLNSQTGEITATWINPDRTPRPAAFGTSNAGALFISGNIGKFNAMYGGSTVRLFLV